jgi:transposase-like protein
VGFEKMRASPQVITSAMQLYFTGESLRNVQKFLRLQGVEVTHVAVYKWIKKYVGLMEKYLEKITPKVSDTWRADEMYLKVKGNTKYLYAMMDDETRFWIAQQVSSEKNTATVRPMFKKAKEYAGKRPDVLITDGAINFQDAFNKEYWTMKNPRPLHVRHITIKGDRNNNKMERLNNEIRYREKTFRGLKKMDTPIIEGYRIYHNYVRPHMALEGRTPADMAGIKIEGDNKWITLIQNATQNHAIQ